MSTLTLLSFLFFLSFSSSFISAETIYFNNTQEVDCVAGCSFYNSSLWINNIIPDASSDVIINSSIPIIINIIDETTSWINSLTFTNVTLNIIHSNFTSYSGITFNNNAILSIDETSLALIVDTPVIMPLNGDSALIVYGTFVSINTTYLFGNVTAYANSHLHFREVIYFPNNIIIDPSANLTILSIEVPHYGVVSIPFSLNVASFTADDSSEVTVLNSFNAGTLNVVGNSTFTFNNINGSIGTSASSISGTGTISINNSNFTIASENLVIFNGTLNLSGSDVFFSQLQLSTINEYITPSSTIEGDGLILNGNLYLPSGIIASGRGIKIIGNVTAKAFVYVLFNSTLEITSSGLLEVADLLFQTNSTFKTAGSVMLGTPLLIPFASSLITSGPSILEGSLTIHGLLDLAGDRHLTVIGNVTLGGLSRVFATLTDASKAVLFVDNGTLSVNGSLSYKMTRKPLLKKSVKFLVAEVKESGTIIGAFSNNAAPPLDDSAIDRVLSIAIDSKSITVQYLWNAKDVPWWVWLILSVGVITVITVIISIAVRCRRHRYEPVR